MMANFSQMQLQFPVKMKVYLQVIAMIRNSDLWDLHLCTCFAIEVMLAVLFFRVTVCGSPSIPPLADSDSR